MKRLILLALLALLTTGGFKLYRASASDKYVTDLTKDCELVFLEDISTGTQKRLRAFAASSASTPEERTATGMAIAKTLIRATGYDYAKVFLQPTEAPRSRDNLIFTSAIIEHAPYPPAIPFMDATWTATAATAAWSDSFSPTPKSDMTDFAFKIEDSTGPRASCEVSAQWTDSK